MIAVLAALLIYPIIHFISSRKLRITAFAVMLAVLAAFGWMVWPEATNTPQFENLVADQGAKPITAIESHHALLERQGIANGEKFCFCRYCTPTDAALIERIEFPRKWLKSDVWDKQGEILQSIAARPRTAVKACHSSGKTFIAASVRPVVPGAMEGRHRSYDGADKPAG